MYACVEGGFCLLPSKPGYPIPYSTPSLAHPGHTYLAHLNAPVILFMLGHSCCLLSRRNCRCCLPGRYSLRAVVPFCELYL